MWLSLVAVLCFRVKRQRVRRTRRNVELWAACIAGAIPQQSYLDAIADAGFEVTDVRDNPYEFVSERALDACSTYEVKSISLVAVRR